LIVGSGVVGHATGEWLEANGYAVIYNDKKPGILDKLMQEGKSVSDTLDVQNIDMFWICTPEWNVEDVIKCLPKLDDRQTVVIRSTMKLGSAKRLQDKYKICLAHVPEFLKQSTSTADVFNPDRIIIGTDSLMVYLRLHNVFRTLHVPCIMVSPSASELIKLVSNAWLATQISFWNQIYDLSRKIELNPEEIANAVTLDKRISAYGSNMTGKRFGGFCLPKDLNSIIEAFREYGMSPGIFDAVKKINERTGGGK